jgi:hypothetical protein
MKENAQVLKSSVNLPIAKKDYGAGADINAEDILIGRIAVVQANSEFIKRDTQDKFRSGQLVNTLSQEILAEKGKPLEVIVLKSFKYWVEKEKTQAGEVFKRKFAAQSVHEHDWEEGNLKRYFHHSFYVLLPSDLSMPLELTFRSTELPMARKLASFIFKLRVLDKSSLERIFCINTEIKTKNTHSWYGTNLTEGRETTPEELAAARMWSEQLGKINITAIAEEEEEAPQSTPSPNADLF